MHDLIVDVCESSSPQDGIRMSDKSFERLNAIKKFNYEYIYKSRRFNAFEEYSYLIINTLFNGLYSLYNGGFSFAELNAYARTYPSLSAAFSDWLKKYCVQDILPLSLRSECYCNEKIYGRLDNEKLYAQAVLDFIAGMTDSFAIRLFEEQLKF